MTLALARLPLPKPGDRVQFPSFAGSADALLLADSASRETDSASPRLLAVITANAGDAHRMLEEIPWFTPRLRVRLLPDWETLPYDSFSPHHDLVSDRLATLYAVMREECDVLLVPASTAVYRLPPPAYLAAYTFFLKQGERLDAVRFRSQLTLAGYTHVTQVVAPGEYSIRGGLVDLFPMGSALPYRLDLFDDEIESIRTFDVDSQRSLYPVPEVRLLPAREFPLDEKGRARFRQRFREVFEGDPARSMIYRDVSDGIPAAGVEYWLPLFFEQTATLFDYLPKGAVLWLHGDVPEAIHAFWQETRSRYDLLAGDRTRPLLPPAELFLSEESFFVAARSHGRVALRAGEDGPAQAIPQVAVERRADNPLARLHAFLTGFTGRVLVLAETPGRRETVAALFREYGLVTPGTSSFAEFLASEQRVALAVSPLHSGFVLDDLAIITEAELFADSPTRRTQRAAQRKTSVDHWLRDLSELKAGSPVVHEQHGVGRYQGLVHLDLGEGPMEFLALHYANDARLYVPVAQLHLISRYSGADPDSAPLHALGSQQWEKARRRAALQARDTAAELLALYAARAARQGHACKFSSHDYEAFADGFGFEETTDQATAIAAVIDDMRSGQPMDRLVCGDVGFGKTEVALRAAFCAVAGGRQVAVLCPTTLLCEQHFQTFSDRFAEWPVRIAELSRFRSAREASRSLAELADGRLDIVIGTHRLLQQDVRFKRLGLVIIDEEHRFGVRQKEALKALRAEVDVLTLTATPIPRTLAMSLEGLRDFSVIATAPQKRLAIRTFVTRFSEGIIREALLREFKRGGQVYFLHNEVETIENMRQRLARLLPEARIVVGHGQMRERELERVMRDFTQQRANLMLCTTIIETGIDNPHANTIVINRAEKFGLAQLHQLRGRVGRSHHQAYAYLLIDGEAMLNKQARQRLEAIEAMDELGAGFYLAMNDLEIRGAGEVLGARQSGEMQEVGFHLFSEMLARAVAALREGIEPDLTEPLAIATEIKLHTPALLPDDYAPDVHERLRLYKRLADCQTAEALGELQEELIDRFGELPAQAEALLDSHRLRLLCKPLGIARVDAGSEQLLIQFTADPPIDPQRIIELIQKDRNFRLAGPDRLLVRRNCATLADRVAAVRDVVRQLSCKSRS
ncbi:MAG: transcription-repair coupling factor [Candidatus Accumulibacter sp.]|uniref:transcription-repair coupling factor n=1 Tax=Accumulibacter sp. TaxID=2053492 RepID=UPI0025FF2923|nr:transcription-repair coupling factor [Accumulibacter sp.]MCM8596103.1 transcription-repair coupling factor [Accumulibacter sp.]MCM8626996.1 transcription-repair coupling factor [Accumulibacter sp.]MDS4050252.1 transcription-repair coupling factor [Accumulibacter sp.]